MKVHKITLCIIDHDDVGVEAIRCILQDQHYPNHCIYPSVQAVETREVDWSDDHPLNKYDTAAAAFQELFSGRPASDGFSARLTDTLRALEARNYGWKLTAEYAECRVGEAPVIQIIGTHPDLRDHRWCAAFALPQIQHLSYGDLCATLDASLEWIHR